MIIDKLTLHNFGVYAGRHEIDLTPMDPKRPITLFGGLNGGGKTTFLDALLLVLYGKFAKCSNRGSLSYDDFLRNSINRNVSQNDGASIELSFRHRQMSVEESVKICRSWRGTGKGVREDVTVYRGDQIDPECTERWYEFIEELIPSRIANLFFFDGEKIEDLATPEQAAELIKTGIHALLGLDLVETLERDLRVVERRRKSLLGTTEDQERLQTLTAELGRLNKERERTCQEKAALQTQLDAINKERRRLAQSYRDQGGELYDQRAEIMDAHERAIRELISVEDRIREVAAGDAPLLLVEKLLIEAQKQCVEDKKTKANSESLELLETRDRSLLQHLRSIDVETAVKDSIIQFLESDREERAIDSHRKLLIGVEPEAFSLLQAGRLDTLRQTINDLLLHADRVQNEIAKLDGRLASIPDPDGLEGISKSLSDNEKAVLIFEHKLVEVGNKQDHLGLQIERKQMEVENLLDSNTRSQFATEKSKRVIMQASNARSILSEYQRRMASKHIRKLEQLILDSYLLLMRKESLVATIRIRTENYELSLYTADRSQIPLDRLSAGERQLLAIAILWGLSKASGRPLPTVIDTPLGRLDGAHRENLVNSYFPAASHQVILLSTDKEIDPNHYESLCKSISREYSIKYDDSVQSSHVVSGYFWKGAA
jgi:DNA sulfur modification protein DndD